MTEEKTTKKNLETVVESVKATSAREEKIVEDNIVTLSNGIVFRVSEVPQTAFIDLRNSFPEPTPPIFFNEDYGREEPNVNDPRYLAEYSDWEISLSSGMIDIQLIFGAEVVSVPKGMLTYDDPKFADKLRVILGAMGWSRQDVKELGDTEKFLLWIKYYAARGSISGGNESDLGKLLIAIGRTSGVPEEDVRQAVDNFQG